MVGIGFYDSCDNLADPLYSYCAGESVSMIYANPDTMGEVETILNISVEGYNQSDIVGAGFYEGCGDLSSPLNSGCGEGSVFFAWDNPSQEPLPIKILVNSPFFGPHPEISFFCMPYN